MSIPVDRFFRSTITKGYLGGNQPHVPYFKKGNVAASASLLLPDSHKRRMSGLYKAWATKARMQNGEKHVPVRKKTRHRARLREQVVKEHREIQEIARMNAQAAMEALADIVGDASAQPSVKIAAATVILDRAYGKASQTNINANVDSNAKPSELAEKDLNSRIEETLKRVEAITGREVEAKPRQKRPPHLRKPDRDTDSTTRH